MLRNLRVVSMFWSIINAIFKQSDTIRNCFSKFPIYATFNGKWEKIRRKKEKETLGLWCIEGSGHFFKVDQFLVRKQHGDRSSNTVWKRLQ